MKLTNISGVHEVKLPVEILEFEMPKFKFLKRNQLRADKPHTNQSVVPKLQNCIAFYGIWVTGRSYHLLLNVIARMCFFTTLIVQVIDMVMAREDLAKFFEFYSVFSFCAMAALKLKSVTGNKQKWSELLLTLNALEEKLLLQKPDDDDYDSEGEDSHGTLKSYSEKYTVTFNSVYNIIIKVYYFTLTIFFISPIVEFAFWKVIYGQSMNPHFLHDWTPLDDFGLLGYLVTVLVEFIAAFYTVIVHVIFDLMVIGLMIMISGQFQLLRKYSEHIAGNGNGYDVTQRRDKRARLRIKKCHSTLVTLEKSVVVLEKLVRDILGIYFMVAICTLCSVALRLSVEQMSIMKIASLLQYTSGCLIQLYFFCYYGDILLHQSSVGVGEGPYATAWWRLSPRVRSELLLLGVGQARVKRLRAGPVNTLDLVSFIQIVRTAYSYYAVISKQSNN